SVMGASRSSNSSMAVLADGEWDGNHGFYIDCAHGQAAARRVFCYLAGQEEAVPDGCRKAHRYQHASSGHGVRTMHSLDGVLDRLASLVRIDDATRLYRIELPQAAPNLLVERWCGHESLSQG